MNFMKSRQLAMSFVILLAASACQAQSPAAVAKVNGVTIPQSKFDFLLKAATSQGQPDTAELRARIRDELITREVVSQEATKKGLDKNREVTTQIELGRQGTLVNAYLQEYVKNNPITEETMKKEYERVKAQMGDKEYHAHHILVKQEEDAKQIIAQIKKGANFEKLAAEKSEDQGSKVRGGDLDWSPPGRYVKPFADALMKLKKGQVTDTPVKTDFGYHVIRLDDERNAKVPPFEEVKPNVQQQLQNQAVQKVIADLRAKAKVE